MAPRETITIDTSTANVSAMMERGQFHSWQDGRWRYSPYGGETVYCNDPSENLPDRASFEDGWAAAADPTSGLYATYYGDGTRSMGNMRGRYGDAKTFQRMALIYAPRHEGERQQRQWLASQFGFELA